MRRAALVTMALGQLLTMALAVSAAPKASKPPRPADIRSHDFLKIQRTTLWRGRFEFRNVGANIPDLFERYLSRDDAAGERMLASAQIAGIRFARCFGSTWGPANFGVFQSDRARWMSAWDRTLAAADAHGIALVPSLLFNMSMIPEFIRNGGGPDEGVVGLMTPGTRSNALAVEYVTAMAARFRTDPRVLFWEIGNEYNLAADLSWQWKARPERETPTSDQISAFLIQMAVLLKKVDRNHPVTSGCSDMRACSWHLRAAMLENKSTPRPLDYPMDWRDDTFAQYREVLEKFNPKPLDLISVHLYPVTRRSEGWLDPDPDHASNFPWCRNAAELSGRPLFVGEFGQDLTGGEAKALWTQDFLGRMPVGTAPIAAVWAWEFEQEGKATAFTLSPTATPELAHLIAAVNSEIVTDLIGGSPAAAPNPK